MSSMRSSASIHVSSPSSPRSSPSCSSRRGIRALGVRPFKAGPRDYPEIDVASMFTVPFGGGALLLYSVSDEEMAIDFLQVIWVM